MEVSTRDSGGNEILHYHNKSHHTSQKNQTLNKGIHKQTAKHEVIPIHKENTHT